MATNGNHPTPSDQAAALQAMASASAAASSSIEDLLSRAEGTYQMAEMIAREWGSAASADERDIISFIGGQRSDLHTFLRKLLTRTERRANDLRRIVGKLEG